MKVRSPRVAGAVGLCALGVTVVAFAYLERRAGLTEILDFVRSLGPYLLGATTGLVLVTTGRWRVGLAVGGAIGALLLVAGTRTTSEPTPLDLLVERVKSVAARGWVQLGGSTVEIFQERGASASIEIQPGHDGLVLYYGLDPELAKTFEGTVTVTISAQGSQGDAELVSRSWTVGPDSEEKFVWNELSVDFAEHPGLERLHLAKRSEGEFVGARYELSASDLVYWSKIQYWSRRRADDVNVLLISLDTLRPDHMGLYGYGKRPTTPQIDAWARDAVVFEQAIAQAPWTTPSHYSILTSTYPSQNGSNIPFQQAGRVVPDRVPLLSHLLRDAGYHTAAFTGQGSISAHYGFYRGFSIYKEHSFADDTDIEEVFESAVDWLERHKDQKFFLFFHTYEPHQKFTSSYFVDAENIPRSDFKAEQIARYDGDIRHTDAVMGRLFAKLEELGLADDTLVILTSDHGEDLGERFVKDGKPHISHGHTLFDELLHVPLIVRLPAKQRTGRRIPWQVRSVDIVPTAMDLLGLEPQEHFVGVSLMGAVLHGERLRLPAFSEATTTGAALQSVREDGMKYIRRIGLGQVVERAAYLPFPPEDQLYDLKSDPMETRNIASASLEDVARYREELASLGSEPDTGATTTGGSQPLDPQLVESLEALGYVE